VIRTNMRPLTFLAVPEQAYGRVVLGVYELTWVAPLCDLSIWAYEHSTPEYLATKRDLARARLGAVEVAQGDQAVRA
jgi:hypothetical protein